jgi:hypothetical protein
MRFVLCLAIGLLTVSASAQAATFVFNTDPFFGTNALTNPGRDIIGNELFINNFDVSTDVFALDKGVFGVNEILFVNDLASNVPATGVNTVVLQNDDVPFAAGIAANLIAGQITQSGPGFFIYFNSNFDLPRLVFSTDLSDNQADLKILARLTNLGGPAGRAQLPNFSSANFAAVPEPSSLFMAAAGALFGCGFAVRRRRTHR